MITPQKALEGLDGLGLDEAAMESFLAGTAKRVFDLERPITEVAHP